MKVIPIVLYLTVSVLYLSSCVNSPQKSNKDEQEQEQTAAYKWEHIFVKDNQCEHTEAYQCAHVMLDFPVFTEEHMSKPNMFINHYVADLVGYGDAESDALIDLNDVAGELILDYQNTKSPVLGSPQLWHIRLKSKFIHDKDNLFCLLIVSDSFMGGAHASVNKRYMTFDAECGEVVNLLDRINDIEQFKRIAEEKFRDIKKLSLEADLNDAGFQFPNNQFVLPANIGIDEKGYLLHYNTSEIAAYERGPTVIRIDFAELKEE